MSETPDRDGQEGAEAYDALLDDEEGQRNLEDRTFEELPDVEDLTQVAGDRDDDEAMALDASEFDPDAVDDADTEEDNELDYRAATEEREDDLDGQGPEDGFDAGRVARSEIDGLREVADADRAQGGEDDFTDYEARSASDDDLEDLGYADAQGRAKRDGT
jgi:hypothetical protein